MPPVYHNIILRISVRTHNRFSQSDHAHTKHTPNGSSITFLQPEVTHQWYVHYFHSTPYHEDIPFVYRNRIITQLNSSELPNIWNDIQYHHLNWSLTFGIFSFYLSLSLVHTIPHDLPINLEYYTSLGPNSILGTTYTLSTNSPSSFALVQQLFANWPLSNSLSITLHSGSRNYSDVSLGLMFNHFSIENYRFSRHLALRLIPHL